MPKRIKFLLFGLGGYALFRIVILAFFSYNLVSTGYIEEIFLRVFDKDSSTYSIVYKNVEINTFPEFSMYPVYWWLLPKNKKVFRLKENDNLYCVNAVKIAIDKYENKIIDKNLNKVYLFSTLKAKGFDIGGTNYGSNIFLHYESNTVGYDAKWLEKSFHHEFAHILNVKYHNKFDTKDWLAVNEPNFNYGSGGFDFIKSGKITSDIDEECCKLGFLNEYSKSSIDEDMSEIARNLFQPDPVFWEYVNKFEKIKKKTDLMIAFYNKIDSIYTTEYFRRFVPSRIIY